MDNPRGTAAKVALGIAFSGVLFVGCLKPEKFPDEPQITFKSFEQFGDSASLIIAFTDGDGDVGLDASDNTPPFDTGTYYFNLFVDYSELRHGVWTPVEFDLPLYYRIPRITPTGQNKALEGEIAVAIEPWPIIGVPPAYPWDTVRFSIHMVDRALNGSNIVQSDAIKVTN